MLILIIFIVLAVTIYKCSTLEGFRFIRQDNMNYVTEVNTTILCNKKVIQDWMKRELEYPDVYIVYLYTDEKIDLAIILAFDFDKDGYYEDIFIDINSDGYLDLQLQGRHCDIDRIKELYCIYLRHD